MTNFTNTLTGSSMMKEMNIDGYKRSMKLGDVLNMFTELLKNNELAFKGPESELPAEELIDTKISNMLFSMLNNNPFNKMVIRKIDKENTIVYETTNVDLMYVGLRYFNAWVEDSILVNNNEGFCWKNLEDNEAYKVTLE